MSKRVLELQESRVSDERAKRFIRDVKNLGKGEIYVYLWNTDKSGQAPIGLLVDPSYVEATCSCLEDLGAPKSEIKDGFKFNLTSVTGYNGAHMEVYNTGRIIVHCPKGAKGEKITEFAATAFFDVVVFISKALTDGDYASTSKATANNTNKNANAKNTANKTDANGTNVKNSTNKTNANSTNAIKTNANNANVPQAKRKSRNLNEVTEG